MEEKTTQSEPNQSIAPIVGAPKSYPGPQPMENQHRSAKIMYNIMKWLEKHMNVTKMLYRKLWSVFLSQ